MAQEYKHIEPRYRRDECQTDAAIAAAKVSVGDAMLNLFGRRSYTSDGFTVGGQSWIHENGMPMVDTLPSESPAWRRRIEKARREIAEHKDHIEWREQVDAAHIAWASEDVSGLIDFIKGQY